MHTFLLRTFSRMPHYNRAVCVCTETTLKTPATARPTRPHPWLDSVNVGVEENTGAAKHKYTRAVYSGLRFSNTQGQSGGPDLREADTVAGSPWGTFLPRPLSDTRIASHQTWHPSGFNLRYNAVGVRNHSAWQKVCVCVRAHTAVCTESGARVMLTHL